MAATAISATGGLLAGAALSGALWRRREEPTAWPLFGVALFAWVAVATTFSILAIDTVGSYASLLLGLGDQSWLVTAFVYPVIALGLWVIFAFQYTGRGDRMTVVASILVGVLVSFILGPLMIDALIGFEPALALSNFSTFVAIFVMAALSFVSLLVIVDEALRMGGYRIAEAVILGGGVLALAFAPLTGALTQQPAAFFTLITVSSALFYVAVVPLSVFAVLPVVRVVGREQVLTELEAAVVVIDRDQTIQDINPAGVELFDIDRDDVIGNPLALLLSPLSMDHVSLQRRDETDTEGRDNCLDNPNIARFADGRIVTVTVDPVTDARGNEVGKLVLFHDVTERREREQRLGVLNQLLIGTLRKQMDDVATAAAKITSCEQNPKVRKQTAATIWDETTELLSLANKARDVEGILSDDDDSDACLVDSFHRVLPNYEQSLTVVDAPHTDPLAHHTQQTASPVLGVTPAQLDLLLETALDTLTQPKRSASTLVVVGPNGPYTIRTDSEASLETVAESLHTPETIFRLVADHLGVAVDSEENRLMVTLPSPGSQHQPAERDDADGLSVADPNEERAKTSFDGLDEREGRL